MAATPSARRLSSATSAAAYAGTPRPASPARISNEARVAYQTAPPLVVPAGQQHVEGNVVEHGVAVVGLAVGEGQLGRLDAGV